MTSFDTREKEFEARFKHDQELQFKITARRNLLLGLWGRSNWVFLVTPPRRMRKDLSRHNCAQAVTGTSSKNWPLISAPRIRCSPRLGSDSSSSTSPSRQSTN